jgi:hypothetical protein
MLWPLENPSCDTASSRCQQTLACNLSRNLKVIPVQKRQAQRLSKLYTAGKSITSYNWDIYIIYIILYNCFYKNNFPAATLLPRNSLPMCSHGIGKSTRICGFYFCSTHPTSIYNYDMLWLRSLILIMIPGELENSCNEPQPICLFQSRK